MIVVRTLISWFLIAAASCRDHAIAWLVTLCVAPATVLVQPANAQTVLRVDGSAGLTVAGGATGADWAHAFRYLQDALSATSGAASNNRFEVWVVGRSGSQSPISYFPDEGVGLTGGDRSLSFALRNFVAIYGGFENGDTALSDRDIEGNPSILSGDLSGNDTASFGNRSDNSLHVVYGHNVGVTARLDGFRVRGGNADGSGSNGLGGGMLLEQTSASIIRVTFIDNQAGAGGGAHSEGTAAQPVPPLPNAPTLVNCSFLGNDAETVAGGMCNNNAELTVVNTIFSGNTSATAAGFFAGAGDGAVTDTTFINCNFTLNEASNDIGALQPGVTCTIKNCIFWNDSPNEIVPQTGSTVTVDRSNVEGGWTGSGANNINSDPLFADDDGADNTPGTLDDDLQLECGSPSINAGSDAFLPVDGFDLDLDSNSTEALPHDRAAADRTVSTVDQGALETTVAVCIADIGPNGQPDGNVNTDDLLVLLGQWGTCTSPCIADIWPGPCAGQGDGQVDTDDLLLMFAQWEMDCGESFAPGGGTPDPEAAATFAACMAAAEENGLEGEEYVEFLYDCLCEAGVIECDQ